MGKKDHPLKGETVAITNSNSGERAAASFLEAQLREELGDEMVMNLMVFIKKRVDPTDGKVKEKDSFKDKAAWDEAEQDPVFDRLIEKLPGSGDGGTAIIAGGDGTVAWGMKLIDDHFSKRPGVQRPYVAVIPMGTGNDLSRALGFGPGFVRERFCCCFPMKNIEPILSTITVSHRSALDRWHVEIFDRHNKLVKTKQEIMNNYLSIGFDARIAHRFDEFRTENPGLCKTRSGNKIWYARFGCAALCGSPTLKNSVSVKVDGETVDPKKTDGLKNIIVTNIDSFGAGMNVWHTSKKSKFNEQRFDDGVVEVCGFGGSFHMGLAQGGLRKSKKVAQGAVVELSISGNADLDAMRLQVDGEPVTLPAGGCVVKLSKHACGAHRILTTKPKMRSSLVAVASKKPHIPYPDGNARRSGNNPQPASSNAASGAVEMELVV